MDGESSNLRLWIAIIIVLALIWFIANSGPAKIPGLGPLWIIANGWFKNVTGLSLDQIVLALWKLILWVLKALLALLWMALSWALGFVKK
jgi:hypothetical protein